jgi:copper homeostasis protein
MQIILEACVETLEEALRAEQNGANRLELCANLDMDGTTPDPDLIRHVKSIVTIPVKVMIRPRGGDFVYNTAEFEEMLASIELCKALGISEIVTGALLPDRTLDIDHITAIVQAAQPMSITIHKCIDLVPDILEAIAQLKEVPGVRSILSSGQAPTALLGSAKLKEMLKFCESHITLIVAGKVTQENLKELILVIGAKEYHGRCIV